MKLGRADEEGVCTAAGDYDDVRRVCDRIGIPYYSQNFAKEYWDRVFFRIPWGIRGRAHAESGRFVQFRDQVQGFLDFAFKAGADYLATGHYARVQKNGGTARSFGRRIKTSDQTYFSPG